MVRVLRATSPAKNDCAEMSAAYASVGKCNGAPSYSSTSSSHIVGAFSGGPSDCSKDPSPCSGGVALFSPVLTPLIAISAL